MAHEIQLQPNARQVVHGTPLSTFLAQTRALTEEQVREAFRCPYLALEEPDPNQLSRRTFNTALMSFSSRRRTRRGRRIFMCPVSKPDVEVANLVTIGRTRHADIFIDDGSVSKLHAYFARDAVVGTYYLVDAGSTNGTKVAGRRLAPKVPTHLEAGDRIELGTAFAGTYVVPGDLYAFLRRHER